MTSNDKPTLVFGTTPIYGHTMPLRAIARHLISKGYEVIFITGSHFQEQIEAVGAKFVPVGGRANVSEVTAWTDVPPPPPPEDGTKLIDFIFNNMVGDRIEPQFRTLQEVCEDIQKEQPGREVVTVCDQSWWGVIPELMGAPGRKANAVVGIGIFPLGLSGEGVPPFGSNIIPDGTPESVARFRAMIQDYYEVNYLATQNTFIRHAKAVGVTDSKDDQHIFDLQYILPDKFLQMCIPSIEWPRKNLPSNFEFAGGLLKGQQDTSKELPEWWNAVAKNTEKKQIIAVSQGSLDGTDYHTLIVPTMEAMKDNPNVIVVAALGRKGAVLPEGTVVPANARVSDFIPFDQFFPLCSVFVTNAWYGDIQRALSHGLPMVLAGLTTEQGENSARIEYVGAGVNLKSEKPTLEALRDGVEKALSDPKYRVRSRKIEAEMDAADPPSAVERVLEEVIAKARNRK